MALERDGWISFMGLDAMWVFLSGAIRGGLFVGRRVDERLRLRFFALLNMASIWTFIMAEICIQIYLAFIFCSNMYQTAVTPVSRVGDIKWKKEV